MRVKTENPVPRLPIVATALAFAAGGAVASWAMFGWQAHGTEIFLSYVQNGLAWCF